MTQDNGNGVRITRASVVSIGFAAALLVAAIETTWRITVGLGDMRIEQTAGFGRIDGQIQLLKYQLEQQAAQIQEIRSSIGIVAPGKR